MTENPSLPAIADEPLSGADNAWLRMDRPESPMVIVGLFLFATPLTVDDVRSTMAARLLVHRRFLQKVMSRSGRRPQWVLDDSFDIANHVFGATLDGDDVTPLVDELASTQLRRDRPLWEAHVVERYGTGSALVVKLSHSIADGLALMQVLLSLCDDADGVAVEHVDRVGRTGFEGSIWRKVRRVGSMILALIRIGTLRPDPVTSLRASLTGNKVTARSEAIPLEVVRKAGVALGATVNDVLMAAMAGALRRLLSRRGESVDRHIRAMVPFNLRPPEIGVALGNEFGLVLPDLPVDVDGPIDRLAIAKERMDRLKASAEGAAAYALITAMGFSATVIESLLVRFFATKSSLVMTNVPGPERKLYFANRRIDDIVFWVPQAGGIGLGAGLLSYDGHVSLGVIADRAVLDDPSSLASDFRAELDLLVAAADVS